MNTRCIGRAGAACAGVAVIVALTMPAAGQVVWRAGVPDLFQHQRWGSDGTIPGGAAGGGDPTWQANYSPAVPAGPGGVPPARPEDGGFGGWCFQTAVTNQFYVMRQRGYRTFGPAAGAAANPATIAATHDEIKSFETAFDATFNGVPKSTSRRINEVLDARGAGPAAGLNGLISQNFLQQGGSVFYRNARGIDTRIGKGTLYQHAQHLHNIAGDVVNLRLSFQANPAPGSPQDGLWWAGPNPEGGNFHVVTVAGIDTAGSGTLWFSDPDSNRGNTNNDAGWSLSLADWKAAPAGVPTKARRYAAGDAFRPAGAAPANNAERDRFYFQGTLNAVPTSFDISAAGRAADNRYDDVEIKYLETLEIQKGVAKPPPPPGTAPPGTGKKYGVSPGPASTGIINKIWLYPSKAIEKIIDIITSPTISNIPSSLTPWVWKLLPGLGDPDPDGPGGLVPGFDEFGNSRPDGGLLIEANALSPFWNGRTFGLFGIEELEFEYQTLGGGVLEGWDLLYDNVMDPTLLSFGVQTYGENSGYDLPHIQIPAPGALPLLVLAGLASRRRRKP